MFKELKFPCMKYSCGKNGTSDYQESNYAGKKKKKTSNFNGISKEERANIILTVWEWGLNNFHLAVHLKGKENGE